MIVVSCVDIWTACHRRSPYGILLIVAGCGRVMQTLMFGGSVSRDLTGHCWHIWWVIPDVRRKTGWWHHFTVYAGSVGDFASTAASWSGGAGTTSEAGALDFGTVVTVLVSGDSGSEACPGRDDWEFWHWVLAAEFASRESGSSDATTAGFDATGLGRGWCVSRAAKRAIVWPGVRTWIKHSRLCCWNGKQRRLEVVMLWNPPAWQRSVAGRETATNLGRGVSRPDQYWNSTPGPGGGEELLTASRDVATARPVVQPTSQPVLVWPEAVRVSTVLVDATLRQRDRILSTVSDSVMVVTEE